jgi:hypothetical protein
LEHDAKGVSDQETQSLGETYDLMTQPIRYIIVHFFEKNLNYLLPGKENCLVGGDVCHGPRQLRGGWMFEVVTNGAPYNFVEEIATTAARCVPSRSEETVQQIGIHLAFPKRRRGNGEIRFKIRRDSLP